MPPEPMVWPQAMSSDMLWFLLTKPAPRIIGARCCAEGQVTLHTGRNGTRGYDGTARHRQPPETGRCTRPVWGDGTVDGVRFDMCALCFHNWAAFNGYYRLIASSINTASAKLDDKALESLHITRKLDGSQAGVRCGCGRMGPSEQIICPESTCPHRPADEHEGAWGSDLGWEPDA